MAACGGGRPSVLAPQQRGGCGRELLLVERGSERGRGLGHERGRGRGRGVTGAALRPCRDAKSRTASAASAASAAPRAALGGSSLLQPQLCLRLYIDDQGSAEQPKLCSGAQGGAAPDREGACFVICGWLALYCIPRPGRQI